MIASFVSMLSHQSSPLRSERRVNVKRRNCGPLNWLRFIGLILGFYCGAPMGMQAADGKSTRPISAGPLSTLIQDTRGRVWGVGHNSFGEGGGTIGANKTNFVKLAALTNIIGVASGGWWDNDENRVHALALDANGTVFVVGHNQFGQLGDGTIVNKTTPTRNPRLTNIVAVAAGGFHSVFLSADGKVWTCGHDGQGQIGNGSITGDRTTPVRAGSLTNIIAIAASHRSSFALQSDGTLWSWGRNNHGQLGINSTIDQLSPVKVHIISNVVDVVAGFHQVLALKGDGTVWAFGLNGDGQLGDGSNTSRDTAVKVSNLSNIVAIAAGGFHSLALRGDGKVFSWGRNSNGQLGNKAIVNSNIPVTAAGLDRVVAIGAGIYHSLALDREGRLWGWGYNRHGQIGSASGFVDVNKTPKLINKPAAMALQAENHTILLKREGTVWTLGQNDFGQLGNGSVVNNTHPTRIQSIAEVIQVAAGGGHSAAVQVDGTLLMWGANTHGQLGDADSSSRLFPTKVNVPPVQDVSLGAQHSAAVATDGTVWTWGANLFGQAGSGNITNIPNPTVVPGVNGVAQISVGGGHTLCLTSNGLVWTWGRNKSGELGDATLTNRAVPVQVSALNGIVALSAGSRHSLALSSAGLVFAWGDNSWGQLGDGTRILKSIPASVSGLTEIRAVAAGSSFSAALGSNGLVYMWGDNSRGQMGQGTTAIQLVPAVVPGLSSITAIHAAENHLIATLADGSVQTWGNDWFGQLGTRSLTNQLEPTTIPSFQLEQSPYIPYSRSSLAQATRFTRGTGTNATYHSFVVTVGGQMGVSFSEIAPNLGNYFSVFTTAPLLHHYNGTNTASETDIGLRLPFQTPIAAFGSRIGGSSLYTYRRYTFGVYAGNPGTEIPDTFSIRIYARSNLAYVGSLNASLPVRSQTNDWAAFVAGGYSKAISGYGLTTTISHSGQPADWSTGTNMAFHLTHECNAQGRAYVFEISLGGRTDRGWMVVDGAGAPQRSQLYTIEFDDQPSWRSTFIDQPHFSGEPLPSTYAGHSVLELLNYFRPVTNQLVLSEPASSYTNLNHSPELRRHPVLDQFVSDLGADPIALANYVFNEIELTDALSYNDAGSIGERSINPPGVSRSAAGVFMEGQGSAIEQCALLVYLLRQAGVPAVYVYPPRNGVRLFDDRLSKLLRMRIPNAVNALGDNLNNTINLAAGKTAQQSSVIFDAGAGRALDGNRNGRFSDGSVTHTFADTNAWWEVDLGESKAIGDVQIWGRTDCCEERLSNFYVLVSDAPIPSLAIATNHPLVKAYFHAGPMIEGTIPIRRSGRYVRIQLAGQDYLSLAEVRVTSPGTLIPVNYPWVAAYVGTNWVHLFPWLKDTEMVEGLDLYEQMPSEYDNAFKWIRHYVKGNTNILGLSHNDTPGVLFPKLLKRQLTVHHPGISLDDVGNRIRNRRHQYARWSDFPVPTAVTNVSYPVESLAVITNVFPSMTNLFDTVSIDVISLSNTVHQISTGEMLMADIHNRQFLLWFRKTNSIHHMILSLAGYHSGLTNRLTFAEATAAGAPLTNMMLTLAATKNLQAAEVNIVVRLTQRRHRALDESFTTNPPPRWDAYLGFSQIQPFDSADPVTQERIVRKGDVVAICLNPGRVSPRMLDVHAQRFWATERKVQANNSFTNKLTPEIYQGTLAYLMGMAYYERVNRFKQLNERLHKMQTISWQAAGLSKFLAKRNADGSLPNGNITYLTPTLDIFFQKLAFAANGSSRPDLGESFQQRADDYLALFMTDAAAQEHEIINTYLRQSSAVSAVKLLQLASTNGSGGVIELNVNNFHFHGTNKYNGKALKNYDPTLWSVVAAAFTASPYSNYVQAYITPGAVTNRAGKYVGALVLAGNSFAALISTNLNGGSGESFSEGGVSDANVTNLDLDVEASSDYSSEYDWDWEYDDGWDDWDDDWDDYYDDFYYDSSYGFDSLSSYDYHLTYDLPTLSRPYDFPSSFSLWDFDSFYDQAEDNLRLFSGFQTFSLQSYAYDFGLSPTAKSWDLLFNVEFFGDMGRSSWYGDRFTRVSDPVNIFNGEFYIDTVDLRLNGPMPLEIRRNYGSQNRAENEFGYGWKMSYFSYLVVATNQPLIYAAEMDGSVIAYRTNGAGIWRPVPRDNPHLENVNQGEAGALRNPFNNILVMTVAGTATNYTLHGSDGSRRAFKVEQYPLGSIDRRRPYLKTWHDAHGNFLEFFHETNSTRSGYGLLRLIVSSSGRRMGFEHDAYGHILEAFTDDGRRVKYDYDKDGDLVRVILPDGAEIGYEYERIETTNSVINTSCFDEVVPYEFYPGDYLLQRLIQRGSYVSYTGPTEYVPRDCEFQFSEPPRQEPPTWVPPYTTSDGVRISGYWIPGRYWYSYWPGDICRESYYKSQPGYVEGDVYQEGYWGPDSDRQSYTIHGCYDIIGKVTPTISTHLLTTETKPDGRTLLNAYDKQRRVTNQWATVGPDLNPIRNATFIYSNNFVWTNSTTNLISGHTLVIDVFGRTNRYDYTNNLITNIVDSLGRRTTQDWYLPGDTTPGAYKRSLKQRIDPRGLTSTWWYDTNGNVLTNIVSGADLTGDGATSATNYFTYATNNVLLTYTDPVGNRSVRIYGDPLDPYLPTAMIKRAADGTVIASNAIIYTNVIAAVTNGNLVLTNYIYGLIALEIKAAGSPEASSNLFLYDQRGLVTTRVQFAGTEDPNVTNTLFYNTREELVQETDAAGRSRRYAYDAMGRRTMFEVFEAGSLTPLSWEHTYYNENGEIVWVDGPRFDPEDYVWRDYDGAGRMVQEIRWRSRARADGQGVEAETGDALFVTIFHEYDAFGNQIATRDQLGNTMRRTYDAVGQMTGQRYYASDSPAPLSSQSFAYEPGGQMSLAVNPLGGATTNSFTTTGRLKGRLNPDGTTNGWTYYLDGRLRREYLPNGHFWETTYDDINRSITRTFSANPSINETTIYDRHGNVRIITNAVRAVFINVYDGLNRLKAAMGPPDRPGFYAQQVTTFSYDGSGRTMTATNALGEQTTTTYDALQRPVLVQVRTAGAGLTTETITTYAKNHHSVAVVKGLWWADGITNITFTDTFGKPVLTQHFPARGTMEFTSYTYDVRGNQIASRDGLNRITLSDYDALNRVSTNTLPDGARVVFRYNPAGAITNRLMPGGLTWSAVYDNANRIVREDLKGGVQTTRTSVYEYYTAGPFVGLLRTLTDGRGVMTTNTYDDFRHLQRVDTSGVQPSDRIHKVFGRDPRGLIIMARQSCDDPSVATITISRYYGDYGQLLEEGIDENNLLKTSLSQRWDAAGRRSHLQIGQGVSRQGLSTGDLRIFGYRADGRLTSVTAGQQTYSYAYGFNGLLYSRNTPFRTVSVDQRDDRGRAKQITTTVSSGVPLVETLSWRADSSLEDYTAIRSTFTDVRNYGYNGRGQLTNETLAVGPGQVVNQAYQFDTGKLGVLTAVEQTGARNNRWQGQLDALKRVETETNVLNRLALRATGTAPGAAAVDASLDGASTDVTYTRANGRWTTDLEAGVGSHALVATAHHELGTHRPRATNTFSVSGTNDIITSYDGAGNIVSRTFPGGRVQTFTWDAFGRLVRRAERTGANTNWVWHAWYDCFGRRIRTVFTPATNGVPDLQQSTTIESWYDPEVEFLEVAVEVNGERTWKIYGPDVAGTYGGMQGIGGAEATIRERDGLQEGLLNDYFGNAIGTISGGQVNWSAARFDGYGPVQGNQMLPLAASVTVAQALGWQGRWADLTGDVNMGGRLYSLQLRRFYSCDPLGHKADWGLYGYALGNPITMYDPLGLAPWDPNDPNTWKGYIPPFQSDGPRGSGFWSGTPGDSVYEFRLDSKYYKVFGPELPYVKGVPDFSRWQVDLNVNGTSIPGRIPIQMTGNHSVDRDRAEKELAEKYKVDVKDIKKATEGLVFHHWHNGEMVLVPAEINGSIHHTGPASAARAGKLASFLDDATTGFGKFLKGVAFLALIDGIFDPGELLAGPLGPVMSFGDATMDGHHQRGFLTGDPSRRLDAYNWFGPYSTADWFEYVTLQRDFGPKPAESQSIFDSWNRRDSWNLPLFEPRYEPVTLGIKPF